MFHIWKNKSYIAECKKIKWNIVNADRKSKNPSRNEKQKKRSLIIKEALEERLKDVEAEWQLEKCFQGILESTFQYLLQSAIVTTGKSPDGNKLAFGILALFDVRDPLVIIQLTTSFISMAVTFWKLTAKLQVQVGTKLFHPQIPSPIALISTILIMIFRTVDYSFLFGFT